MNYKQRPRDAESLLFAKVKEVTGVNDDMVIRRACEACQDSNGKVKVEDVVTVLLNDDSVHTKTKVILYVDYEFLPFTLLMESLGLNNIYSVINIIHVNFRNKTSKV